MRLVGTQWADQAWAGENMPYTVGIPDFVIERIMANRGKPGVFDDQVGESICC